MAVFHLCMCGYDTIAGSAARQPVLPFSSTGEQPTWRSFIRLKPAARHSSYPHLPYHPFCSHRTPLTRAKLTVFPSDLSSAAYGTMGVILASSLNANVATNTPVVMASIAVSTAPPLPPTNVHALASLPLVSGALVCVLTFCLPSLHLLLCLVLLCIRPIPVHSSSLLY